IFPTDFVVGRPVPTIAPAIRSLPHPTKNRTDGKLLPRLELKRRARPLSLGLAEESEEIKSVLGSLRVPVQPPLLSPLQVSQVPLPCPPHQPSRHHLAVDDVPGVLRDGVLSRLSPGHGA